MFDGIRCIFYMSVDRSFFSHRPIAQKKEKTAPKKIHGETGWCSTTLTLLFICSSFSIGKNGHPVLMTAHHAQPSENIQPRNLNKKLRKLFSSSVLMKSRTKSLHDTESIRYLFEAQQAKLPGETKRFAPSNFDATVALQYRAMNPLSLPAKFWYFFFVITLR